MSGVFTADVSFKEIPTVCYKAHRFLLYEHADSVRVSFCKKCDFCHGLWAQEVFAAMQYRKNEEINYHTENVLLLVEMFGNLDEQKRMKEIAEKKAWNMHIDEWQIAFKNQMSENN